MFKVTRLQTRFNIKFLTRQALFVECTASSPKHTFTFLQLGQVRTSLLHLMNILGPTSLVMKFLSVIFLLSLVIQMAVTQPGNQPAAFRPGNHTTVTQPPNNSTSQNVPDSVISSEDTNPCKTTKPGKTRSYNGYVTTAFSRSKAYLLEFLVHNLLFPRLSRTSLTFLNK